MGQGHRQGPQHNFSHTKLTTARLDCKQWVGTPSACPQHTMRGQAPDAQSSPSWWWGAGTAGGGKTFAPQLGHQVRFRPTSAWCQTQAPQCSVLKVQLDLLRLYGPARPATRKKKERKQWNMFSMISHDCGVGAHWGTAKQVWQ